MKTPIKAFSYTRFSTIEQSKGDSFRRQSEAAEKFCIERGLTLDTTLKLHDAGISAFKGDNKIKGSFAGFIQEIDAGNIPKGSYLIIESLDRLSRQDIDIALTFFMDILRKDIVIATLTDNKIYNKSSLKNLQDIMISLLIMSRANEESKTKSLRICSAYENKRNNGHAKKITSLAPAWFDYDKATDNFKLNDFSRIVKEIFNLSINRNMGAVAISKHLNEDPAKYPPLNKKTGFNHGYIAKILKSRAVYGTNEVYKLDESGRRIKVSEIENYYPGVISFEEYQLNIARTQQRKVSGNKNNGKALSNIFQSLIKCDCGATVIFTNSYALEKFYPYLLCANAKKNMCDATKWRYDHFEELFFIWMKEVNFNEIFTTKESIENKNKIINTITLLEQEYIKLTVEYNNLIDAISNNPNSIIINDLISKAEIKKLEQDEIQQRINSLNVELLNYKVEIDDTIKTTIKSLTENKPKEEIKEIRQTIRNEIIKLISTITFNNDGMVFESGQYMFDEIPDIVLDIVNKRGYKTDEEKEKYFLTESGQRLLTEYTRTFTVNFKNGVVRKVSKTNIHSNEAFIWLRSKNKLKQLV